MKKLGRTGKTFGIVMAATVVLGVATTGGAVAGGLVTSAKIKNNTIKSIDVRDGNLTGVDVADGSLGSADIADGSVGKSDLAGPAQGYTSIVTKVVSVTGVAAGGTTTRDVICPAGSVAIGGGGYAAPTGIVLLGTTAGTVERSHPVTPGSFGGLGVDFATGDGDAPQGWRTVVSNSASSSTTHFHYAICASK